MNVIPKLLGSENDLTLLLAKLELPSKKLKQKSFFKMTKNNLKEVRRSEFMLI